MYTGCIQVSTRKYFSAIYVFSLFLLDIWFIILYGNKELDWVVSNYSLTDLMVPAKDQMG